MQPFGMSSFDFSQLLGPVFAGAGILAPVTMQVHLLFWAPITLLLIGWVTEGGGRQWQVNQDSSVANS